MSIGGQKKQSPPRVISCEKTTDGREVWRVASGDKVRTISTSDRSAKSMDRAVKIFGDTLERLAKQ